MTSSPGLAHVVGAQLAFSLLDHASDALDPGPKQWVHAPIQAQPVQDGIVLARRHDVGQRALRGK